MWRAPLNRRPTGPLLPRSGERSGGLLNSLGPRLPIVAIGAAALLILVLIVVLLGRCGGSSNAQASECGSKPAPPPGFTYASRCWAPIKGVAGQKGQISVPLTDKTATRGLSLYSHDSGSWKAVAPVQVTQDGSSAIVASTIDVPKTFAVLRRAGGDFQVFGALPAGSPAGADAARLMTASVPAAYTPAASGDGSLTGGPVTNPQGASYSLIPSIEAPGTPEMQAVVAILVDDSKRSAHVDRIAAEADRNNYDGVEIDYVTIDASYKKNYTTFVQALAAKLHASKRKLVLRLPLPRRDGNSWNVGAYDWPELAKSADYLVMAAEHDQQVYRQRVPEAVKYLVTQVGDPHKLILEVTPLSEEKSDQGQIRLLSTLEALSIAGQITVRDRTNIVTGADIVVAADNINRENGSGPQWTPQGVVSFQYRSGDEQRTVWMENVYSAGYKLEIDQLFNLGGVSVDNATGNPAIANIWPAIEQYQSTGAPQLQQPNPQSLRPQWLADNKPIPDAGNRAQITWRAPADPGKHTLTVIASEGTMRVASSTTLDVRAGTPASQPSGASPGATPGVRSTAPPTRVAPTASRTPAPR